MTTSYQLTIFFDISEFKDWSDNLNDFINSIKLYRQSLGSLSNCETLINLSNWLIEHITNKREIILESVGYQHHTKRSLSLKTIGQTVKILFRLCDVKCIQN